MALAATTQVLQDGPRNCIVKCLGADVLDPTLFSSMLPGTPNPANWLANQFAIKKIIYSIGDATSATLSWDATTDVDAMLLVGQDSMDFTEIGFLQNNAGAGKTGSINLVKTGTGAMSVVLWLVKRRVATGPGGAFQSMSFTQGFSQQGFR